MSLMPFLEVSEAIAAMGGESVYQCMQCGLCSGLCPWSSVDSPFRTRKLVRMGQMGIEGFENDEILYACTTCKLCVDNCPRQVKIIDVIRSMRAMIAESGATPPSLRPIMGSLHSKGNPWSEPADKREAWTEGLEVPRFDGSQEYLLFVCCTSAYEKRSQLIAKAMVKILDACGVSYGIIGNEERCCGEALRKMGDEEQFGNIVEKNVKMWADKGVQKVITTSPHSYFTFSQEYPELGSEVEAVHYTQLLKELLDQGKLTLSGSLAKKVIYHDPCYLGRHSEVFEEPRELLKAAGVELLEYQRNRKQALCCGGGGGRLWMETEPENRFSTHKMRQADQAGAEMVATCCPYCISMLTDSAKGEGLEEKIPVKDVAEILAECL